MINVTNPGKDLYLRETLAVVESSFQYKSFFDLFHLIGLNLLEILNYREK